MFGLAFGAVRDAQRPVRRLDPGRAVRSLAERQHPPASRHGIGGIRKYCRQQAMLVSGFGPRRELFMFPYSARVTGLLGRLYRAIYGRGRRGR